MTPYPARWGGAAACLAALVLLSAVTSTRAASISVIPPSPTLAPDGSLTIPTLAPGASATYSFNGAPGSAFAQDFDDANNHLSNPSTTAVYSFSGQALTSGSPVSLSAIWSPEVNATGTFVPFLGNNANGVESDATLTPTTVAYLVGSDGKTYGYVQADSNYTQLDNTTFTFFNTSATAIDPTVNGVTVGTSLQGSFATNGIPNPIQTSTFTSPLSSSTITAGPPTATATGYQVPNITTTIPSGQTGTVTDSYTASRSFTATTPAVQDLVGLSGGTVTVTGSGGTGTISVTSTITGPGLNKTYSAPVITFTGAESFNGSSATFNITGLSIGQTYTLQTTYTTTFTPNDTTSSAVIDPGLSTALAPTAVPEPSSLLLAALGASCIVGGKWRQRRRA